VQIAALWEALLTGCPRGCEDRTHGGEADCLRRVEDQVREWEALAREKNWGYVHDERLDRLQAETEGLRQQLAALREGLETLADVWHDAIHGALDSVEEMLACRKSICAEARALLAPPAAEGLENCSLSRKFRDGVACSPTRLDGVCHNHQVIAGLSHHATEADHWEGRARSLTQSLRACQGIIHEGLHGGRSTDPEHQERCQQPACVRVRALLTPPAAEGGEAVHTFRPACTGNHPCYCTAYVNGERCMAGPESRIHHEATDGGAGDR
jgi:hypothetical protein